jgi:hypothetical protein
MASGVAGPRSPLNPILEELNEQLYHGLVVPRPALRRDERGEGLRAVGNRCEGSWHAFAGVAWPQAEVDYEPAHQRDGGLGPFRVPLEYPGGNCGNPKTRLFRISRSGRARG